MNAALSGSTSICIGRVAVDLRPADRARLEDVASFAKYRRFLGQCRLWAHRDSGIKIGDAGAGGR